MTGICLTRFCLPRFYAYVTKGMWTQSLEVRLVQLTRYFALLSWAIVELPGLYGLAVAGLWGRSDLNAGEAKLIRGASQLIFMYLSMAEAVCANGGWHLLEHPADPGTEPYPSTWDTDEVAAFECRTSSRRKIIDQCSELRCRSERALAATYPFYYRVIGLCVPGRLGFTSACVPLGPRGQEC